MASSIILFSSAAARSWIRRANRRGRNRRGAAAGVALGAVSVHYVASLLYGVNATDPSMLVLRFAIIATATLLAALTPGIRALRINPVEMLRAE